MDLGTISTSCYPVLTKRRNHPPELDRAFKPLIASELAQEPPRPPGPGNTTTAAEKPPQLPRSNTMKRFIILLALVAVVGLGDLTSPSSVEAVPNIGMLSGDCDSWDCPVGNIPCSANSCECTNPTSCNELTTGFSDGCDAGKVRCYETWNCQSYCTSTPDVSCEPFWGSPCLN